MMKKRQSKADMLYSQHTYVYMYAHRRDTFWFGSDGLTTVESCDVSWRIYCHHVYGDPGVASKRVRGLSVESQPK